MSLAKENRYDELLPTFLKHKANLLTSVHIRRKQIDCIDYLIYKLKKL